MKTHALPNAHKVRTPHRPQSQPSKIPLSPYLIQRKAVYLARLKHKT